VAVLTQDEGIAATVGGSGCKLDDWNLGDVINCTVIVRRNNTNGTYTEESIPCSKVIRADSVPGSNLYFCVWGALLAAVNIALRWKAAQALQFAQTAQRQVTTSTLPEAAVEVELDEDAI
jgi:hypothetical protein